MDAEKQTSVGGDVTPIPTNAAPTTHEPTVSTESVRAAAMTRKSSLLAAPTRTSSTKNANSPNSSSSTAVATTNDNSSTRKRRRRREPSANSTTSPEDSRSHKQHSIGRFFSAFLCCHGGASSDGESPGTRTTNKKTGSVASRRSTPVGREQVARYSVKDSGLGGSKDAVESEKPVEDEQVKPATTQVETPTASVVSGPISEKEEDMIKSASEGEVLVREKILIDAKPPVEEPSASKESNSLSPVDSIPVVTVEAATPNKPPSMNEEVEASSSEPNPPTLAQTNEDAEDPKDEDVEMKDAYADDDVVSEDRRARRKSVSSDIETPSVVEEDKDTEAANVDDEEEPIAEDSQTHDGVLVQTPTPDDKQQWLLPSLAPGFEGKKCLVLDLDETLVHSSFKLLQQADFTIPVEIEGSYHNVYVIKRPGVDEFMRRVGELYEVVIFTASVSKYGDPLLDQLDIHHVVHHRLFRESCVNHQGNYVKDLSQLGRDLKDTIIIDNSPTSYIFHPQHAVPISSWFSDAHDNELLDLIPVLEDLSKTNVRDVSLVLDVSL
ncbi:hypothetical protein RUND412_007623 [Rhizina undulata]